jgi:hypothetical protein
MNRIRGQEFHVILQNIFNDIQGVNVSEQLQVDCPRCSELDGLSYGDGKHNLEINTAKRVFRCWRCQDPPFSGSLGRLIRTFGTSIDYDLYKSYAGSYNEYSNEDDEKEYAPVLLPEEMISFADIDFKNPEHFEAYNYLVAERKISKEIINKYRLGFCITGKYTKRIIIPSYDKNGEINYFVGRSYDPKEKKKKYDNPKSDKDKIIFNEGYINWDSTIYLMEGAFEMLSFPINPVIMLGKMISSALFLRLKELKPDVVILLDPDAYKNSIELFYILHTIYVGCEERVKIVKLPAKDDLDELRRNYGIDEVIKSLYTARGLTVDDYFISKLQKPYDKRKTGRYDSNSKYFEWKSTSRKNTL